MSGKATGTKDEHEESVGEFKHDYLSPVNVNGKKKVKNQTTSVANTLD